MLNEEQRQEIQELIDEVRGGLEILQQRLDDFTRGRGRVLRKGPRGLYDVTQRKYLGKGLRLEKNGGDSFKRD